MEMPHLFLQEPHRVCEGRCPERIAADQLPEKGSMMGRRLLRRPHVDQGHRDPHFPQLVRRLTSRKARTDDSHMIVQ